MGWRHGLVVDERVVVVGFEQRLDFAAELRIGTALGVEKCLALRRRPLERPEEDLFYPRAIDRHVIRRRARVAATP